MDLNSVQIAFLLAPHAGEIVEHKISDRILKEKVIRTCLQLQFSDMRVEKIQILSNSHTTPVLVSPGHEG